MARCSCSLNYDLDLATRVQQMLFPKSLPLCTWNCLGVKNRMASGLGGDFYDFITMPDGCQVIMIGDVTGHGLHASVVMALLYGYLHRSSQDVCDPVETLRRVNDFLQTFATRSREFDHYFSSTLFWGVIDPQTLELNYVNAGHPPPLLRRGSVIHQLCPTAPPIGYFDHPDMASGRFQLARNDRLLLYTDGLLDACDPAGSRFGQRPLRQALLQDDGDHLEFLERLFNTLIRFEDGGAPGDDCTAIVLDLHPTALGEK